jgi:hypothetical protein
MNKIMNLPLILIPVAVGLALAGPFYEWMRASYSIVYYECCGDLYRKRGGKCEIFYRGRWEGFPPPPKESVCHEISGYEVADRWPGAVSN